MIAKETLDKAVKGFVAMVFGAVLTVVPFYFQTQAKTENHEQTLSDHTESLRLQDERVKELEVQEAVDNAEIKQIKESLDRIESKIDRLIEQGQ